MLSQNENILIIALIAFMLSGCETTPETSIQNYRMQAAEVSNEPFEVNIAIAFVGRNEINQFNESQETGVLLAKLEMTLGNGHAASISNDFNSVHVGYKYQYSGEPTETASAGNFAQTVALVISNRK